MRDSGRLARFVSATAEPERTVSLQADHPAVAEGRTLFPSTVVGAFQSARFLISGDNSSKIGKVVEKGAWAGFPVFTLTLEERATCPRACDQWSACFGNAMPWARRNDAHDPDFLAALKAEVVTLVRSTCAAPLNRPKTVPPKGVVIRLHVLGDFFSVRYVRLWGELMRKLPELRVFGYTAHRVEDGSEIAFALAEVSAEFGDRWMIRTSHREPGAARTIVVETEDAAVLAQPDVILCPAQTKASEVCATCALCWSPAAWGKTVAFLRHGIKRVSGPRGNRSGASRGRTVQLNARGLTDAQETLYQTLRAMADAQGVVQTSVRWLLKQADVTPGNWKAQREGLLASGLVQVLEVGRAYGHPSVYRVFAEKQDAFPDPPTWVRDKAAGRAMKLQRGENGLTPHEAKLHAALLALADARGVVAGNSRKFCAAAQVRYGNWTAYSKALVGAGLLRPLRLGRRNAPSFYQVAAEKQDSWGPVPALPLPAARPRAPVGTDGRRASGSAQPMVARKPGAPLMTPSQLDGLPKHKPQPVKAKYNARGTLLNPSAIGSADRLAVGTPEDRIAAVPETELERIQRMYGASVPKKEAAE